MPYVAEVVGAMGNRFPDRPHHIGEPVEWRYALGNIGLGDGLLLPLEALSDLICRAPDVDGNDGVNRGNVG